MQNPFRFAIIGSGNISRTYFQAIGKIREASVVALVSRGRARPDFVPEKIEIALTPGEIRTTFDAVILATPNGLHHKGAIDAAHLSKHVFSEKPLDITLTNMERMITACRENNRVSVDLKKIASKGKHKSQKVINSQILLGCDKGSCQKTRSTNGEISRVLKTSMRKIDRVKNVSLLMVFLTMINS